jgi:hypothetical protein
MSIHWYKERLADVSLLDHAVRVLCSNGEEEIAVPVGGKRRGGYITFDTLKSCGEAVKQLKDKPGFPNLRIIRARPYCVDWGDPQPEQFGTQADIDRKLGRYFGYKESAIDYFVSLQGG